MPVDKSDRYSLPLLLAGQAQKEITHNEAFILTDMLLHARAESAVIATPPGGAAIGQCWIVATGGTAEWAGQDGSLACLTSGGWRFIAPRAGLRVSTADDGETHVHDGSGWALDAVRSDGFYVAGDRIVGARQPPISDPTGGSVVDTQARTALSLILGSLRTHGLIE